MNIIASDLTIKLIKIKETKLYFDSHLLKHKNSGLPYAMYVRQIIRQKGLNKFTLNYN